MQLQFFSAAGFPQVFNSFCSGNPYHYGLDSFQVPAGKIWP